MSAADDDAASGAYPAHWEADVVLRDGTTMHIRPIRPTDADAIQRMHLNQSEQSVYYRFFAPLRRLSDADLRRFTHVDHEQRVALVLTRGDEIAAVGRFDVIDPGEAEVAFNVSDAEQGRGLGSVLLDHLAAAARERGVHRFLADVLPANYRMVAVFRDAGYEVDQELEDGVLRVSFSIEETERSWTVMAEREQRAEALSMRTLLSAGSVLVLGSGRPGVALAERAAGAVLAGAFTGPVHLVGANPPVGAGRAQQHSDLDGVTGPVELAVLAAPPREVLASVPALAALGVGALVVLSGGFAEAGPTGTRLQRELLRSTRAAGIRLLGPASYGVVGEGDAGPYDLTLWHGEPGPGHGPDVDPWLGIFCQSSPSGLTLRAAAHERALPVRSFVSAGNRADVSGNDTMQSWGAQPGTRTGALQLESLGNARKFSRVARRLSATMPLVALISGRTGQVTPPGHAVRTSRLPRRVLEELLRQAGVVQVDTLAELLDAVTVLGTQPLPAGGRTAVLAGSEALAALVAESVRTHGLTVAGAPVALGPTAGAAEYAAAAAQLAGRTDWDAVVVAHAPLLGGTDKAVARAVAEVAGHDGRTWVASVFGLRGLTEPLAAGGGAQRRVVPAMATPDDAVRALAAAERYARWRSADRGRLVDPQGVDPVRARALVARSLVAAPGDGPVRLDAAVAAELLACYGLPVLTSVPVEDEDEAVAAAERLGWPVALKTTDLVLRHRADLGGVRLDLGDPAALREAVLQMRQRTERVLGRATGLEVQPMAPPGAACVVRGTEDALYGPVVAFGLGGDAVELLEDVSYRVPPLTEVDVREMVRSVRAAPRLLGHRGLPVLDVAALEDVIARVSMLTDDLPEVATVELNPVIVAEQGAVTTSAVVDLARPVRTDSGRRTLPG